MIIYRGAADVRLLLYIALAVLALAIWKIPARAEISADWRAPIQVDRLTGLATLPFQKLAELVRTLNEQIEENERLRRKAVCI